MRIVCAALSVVLVVSGACLFAGCSGSASSAQKGDETHLIIKVPDTKHTAICDGTITTIDQVIQRMADAYMQDHPEKTSPLR